MIREATHEDIPALVVMSRMFLDSTILKDIAPFDTDSAITTFKSYMDSDSAAVFVVETDVVCGFFTGILVPAYWNFNILCAQQCAWFVHPAYRSGIKSLKLLDTWEKWAKEHGATVFISGAKKDRNYKSMDRMLTKKKYNELESVHIKGV